MTLLVAALVSVLGVAIVRAYALRRNLLDRPNERSSHAHAKPRGGGLGLIAAFVIAIAVGGSERLDGAVVFAVLGVLLVAAVGWRDDHGGVSVRARLICHMTAACFLLPSMPTALDLSASGLLWAGWWLFWVVSSINVTNFMDGIDGFIGLQAVVFGAYTVAVAGAESGAGFEAMALIGASVGFLAWNWAPSKIFLGDVGSGAIGVVFVLVGMQTMRDATVGVPQAFLPLYPMFLDASVTLARRAARGERLSQAHRSHLYQRLANGGWGHARVSLLYGVAAMLAVVPQLAETGMRGWLTGCYVVIVLAVGISLDRRAMLLAQSPSPR